MERESSHSNRLYSGPLSASGKKILAALRAQNRSSATARAPGYRQDERFDVRPRGYQSEAIWSRGTLTEQDRRVVNRSRPQIYSQFTSSDPVFQRDYCLTPAASQSSIPFSNPRERYSLALHNPSKEFHCKEKVSNYLEEKEPTISLYLPLEDHGFSRSPFSRTEHPRPHREEPTVACGPPYDGYNASQAPKNHVTSLDSEHLVSGDGGWQYNECSQEESVLAPMGQRERLAKAKHIAGPDRWGPGPVAKLQLGSLQLPPLQRIHETEGKPDCGQYSPGIGCSLHTVEREEFTTGNSWPTFDLRMEDDVPASDTLVGFRDGQFLAGDGFGARHALQKDTLEEKRLFNDDAANRDLRDTTDKSRRGVVALVEQQVVPQSNTTESVGKMVTKGGPGINCKERDHIKRELGFSEITTDTLKDRKTKRDEDLTGNGEMNCKGVTEMGQQSENRGRHVDGSMETAAQRNPGNTEHSAAGLSTLRPSQECARAFRAPCPRRSPLTQNPLSTKQPNNTQKIISGGSRGLYFKPVPTDPSPAGNGRYVGLGPSQTSTHPIGGEERSSPQRLPFAQQTPLSVTLSLKRKHASPSRAVLLMRPLKWEPPRPSQDKATSWPGAQEDCRTSTTKRLDPALTSAHSVRTRTLPDPPCPPPARPVNPRQGVTMRERGLDLPRDHSSSHIETNTLSKTPKPNQNRAEPGTDHSPPETGPDGETGNNDLKNQFNQSKACLTTAITSDPRVRDAGKLSGEERGSVLEEAREARALVLTMVYQDGTTQMDPEQKLSPLACGVLVLLKTDLDQTGSGPEEGVALGDSVVYLRLEQKPRWAQSHLEHNLDLFTREILLQILSGSQLVVCYKAKDLLRTALQRYRPDLHWKQVSACRVHDPQVAAWLLDPADPSSSFSDLLTKHCRWPPRPPTPALGTRKVSQTLSGLSQLYRLNMELQNKLQSQSLWELYSIMELTMIPVLAAMESHRIHVDKDALKRTSEMLGAKMKQLEQDAHQAAGQKFLVSSSTQLRTVLFEKLRLQKRCENKKLPKTLNKQQHSTSEATLLQLQDLHPLPKIILEYRQVHKIKSNFVDGILSCMMNKNFISSTWYQTSAVTGRISAKHPNFQALPRQPVQITSTQHVHGKEAEVVTVHPRSMFIPQDGCTFLAADFCHVELRLLAHLSSDPELLRIFHNPQADVFSMLASQWKGVNEVDVTSEDREHAKRIVYSVVYGAGRERLSGILGVSAEMASQFQDSFLHSFREVQNFIHTTIQQCHKQGYVLSIMGRRRSFPHVNSVDWGVRMQAERQAVNFVVQASAADLCKMAMIQIFSKVSSSSSLSARLVAQLHDELLYEVEDSQVEEFAVLVKNTMESLQHVDCLGVHLKVPLKVAVSSGKSWGSMSELHLPQASFSSSS
ncbi:hypothetical protein DPEC_G00105160 [Dallia pectoralis]|uniref:Uncharacterized protein n=1 Tax=Dallia pectoralis TaxID=75939 RepID=A0ACC2GXQ7_DALPE|nr:hypothetical protein DPEC_G00105160 [Dallia pectoralis]